MCTKTKNKQPRIAIVDSGIGGVSILEATAQRLPHYEYIYCMDRLYFPYGTKTSSQIENRVVSIILEIERKYSVDLVILACNTASTVSLPQIRSKIKIPVVGVVPAIKPAVERSASKVIGVLATPLTIASEYTSNLIKSYAKNCKVILHGSSNLVHYSEENLTKGIEVNLQSVSNEIVHLTKNKQIDTIVLACTHFSHLRSFFVELCSHICWVDSAQAVASRVVSVLGERDHLYTSKHRKSNLHLLTTKIESLSLDYVFRNYLIKSQEILTNEA